MIIDILDEKGVQITVVENVDDPESEVKSYKGFAWRIHTKSPSDALDEKRRKKASAIKDHASRLITNNIPALRNPAIMDLLVELWPMLNTTAATTNMQKARDIYLYAKTKIRQLSTATAVQIDAYDPENDNGWP